jgi:hypothetical protein
MSGEYPSGMEGAEPTCLKNRLPPRPLLLLLLELELLVGAELLRRSLSWPLLTKAATSDLRLGGRTLVPELDGG